MTTPNQKSKLPRTLHKKARATASLRVKKKFRRPAERLTWKLFLLAILVSGVVGSMLKALDKKSEPYKEKARTAQFQVFDQGIAQTTRTLAPASMAHLFFGRLADKEYGEGGFSWEALVNPSIAQDKEFERLKARYPDLKSELRRGEGAGSDAITLQTSISASSESLLSFSGLSPDEQKAAVNSALHQPPASPSMPYQAELILQARRDACHQEITDFESRQSAHTLADPRQFVNPFYTVPRLLDAYQFTAQRIFSLGWSSTLVGVVTFGIAAFFLFCLSFGKSTALSSFVWINTLKLLCLPMLASLFALILLLPIRLCVALLHSLLPAPATIGLITGAPIVTFLGLGVNGAIEHHLSESVTKVLTKFGEKIMLSLR